MYVDYKSILVIIRHGAGMNDEIDGYDEIIKEFLAECSEHLDLLDKGFVIMEQNTSDRSTLAEIFRSIHTIKGGAGMLAFPRLEKVTHAAESLLALLRDGKLELTTEIITCLLKTVDVVREMLELIDKTGADGTDEQQQLIQQLLDLQSPAPQKGSTKSKKTKTKAGTDKETTPEPTIFNEVEDNASEITIFDENKDKIKMPPFIKEPLKEPVQVEKTQPNDTSVDSKSTGSTLDASIRINVVLLDKLMNLVGELVLSRNQILQSTYAASDSAFVAITQRLNLITSELQEGVMKTRMQPIGTVWSKFTRIVRDLAVSCKKQVKLELYGKETELDKTLIEAIKDPLTHIVRNSVDHGLELPEQRLLAGKAAEGIITLKAYHEGGYVHIEINDDGAGLSAEKLKAKALQKGLISLAHAEQMSEREAFNLIFLPGFSTAEQVTNISGRGVGMDVVRTNIENINGTIELHSKQGEYTTIKIKIPLTLAIIPALIITCQKSRYAIPQVNLLELVRLDINNIDKHIKYIKDAPVYKLRDKLLPLIYLSRELELKNVDVTAANDCLNIVVLQAGKSELGLVVDSINDTQEIVVKPLNKLLKNIPTYAGATIMGDGTISLILDAVGIAKKAGLLGRSLELNKKSSDTAVVEELLEKQMLLLLSVGPIPSLAVPLDKVERIEECDAENIELIGSQEVLQYRNAIMPLVRLSKFLNVEQAINTDSTVQIIVHTKGSHNYGLVVDKINDIVEGSFRFDKHLKRPGVMGVSVVEDKVTEVLDIEAIMQEVIPLYYSD